MRKVLGLVMVAAICGVGLAAYGGRSEPPQQPLRVVAHEQVVEDELSKCMTFDGHRFVPSRRVRTFERTYAITETASGRSRTLERSELLTDICER